ncbi:MAG: type IV pilus modification PilV family protein [Fimbriiglobus sp.]
MTRRRTRAARPGVTLLEVLRGLAIFLIALTGIAQLVDAGADRSSDAVWQNTGTRLAQSKLAEAEAGVIDPSVGGSGTFDDEPGWEWTIEAGSPPVPNLYPVTVTVWRDVRGTRFQVALSQMILDPAQTGTAAEAQPPTTATTAAGTGS